VNFEFLNAQFQPSQIVVKCLDYDWYFLGGKFQNSKLFCHFLLHRKFTTSYLCTCDLSIHVAFLEHLSFEQFKLISRITIKQNF
jgi:hypothetical protein